MQGICCNLNETPWYLGDLSNPIVTVWTLIIGTDVIFLPLALYIYYTNL